MHALTLQHALNE